MLQVIGREIENILIVDDSEDARLSTTFAVEELGLTPVLEEGPIDNFEFFLEQAASRSQAAICDYNLQQLGNYSRCDGTVIVARMFDKGFPAILSSQFDRSRVEEIRRFRDRIPVLLNPADVTPETIQKGLETCLLEIQGSVAPDRKTHRTLVRVEDVDQEGNHRRAFVIVPAWNTTEAIRLRLKDIDDKYHSIFVPGFRCFARVNLGADNSDNLFFTNWEFED